MIDVLLVCGWCSCLRRCLCSSRCSGCSCSRRCLGSRSSLGRCLSSSLSYCLCRCLSSGFVCVRVGV